MDKDIAISKTLAPEDVKPGDFVAVLSESCELINFFALIDPLMRRPLVVRADLTPCDAGAPLRVVSVCLPFVLVEDGEEKARTLDVRRQSLVRLDEEYARRAMKKMRKSKSV